MSSSLEAVYREHHHGRRRGGFAILEKERGALFKKLVGTDKKVLDLGCRDGVITKYFVEGNDVTGADIDLKALEDAKNSLGIKTINFDIQSEGWPIEHNSFDVVVAGELLEHLYFPSVVIKRIGDVLKSGGVFVGSIPNAFALKNRIKYLFANKKGTPMEDPMHINHFSFLEIEKILKDNFVEVKLFPLGKKYYGLANYFPGLLAHSLAFVCVKA